ncbi:MAG: hypothetical protein ACUVV3_01325 [Dehalococcoidia bacterium]
MKVPWRCLLVAAVLVAGPLLGACGGEEEGGEITLDQYFQRFEAINTAAGARINTLVEESAGLGADIEITQDYFDEYGIITEEAVHDFKDLHPPAEVRDAHDEFVAALEDMLREWKRLGDRLADVESPSDLEPLLAELDEPPFDTAMERLIDVCPELQRIADENGIDVDLKCAE